MRINSITMQGKKMWFLPNDYAVLMLHDFETDNTTIEAQIPGCKIDDIMMYSALVMYKNEIIIAPGKASEFYLYNIESKEIKQITVTSENNIDVIINSSPKFGDVFLFDESKACFVGQGVAGVAIFDFETRKLDYFPVTETIHNMVSRIFGRNTVRDGNEVFLPLYRGDKVVTFNLSTKEYVYEQYIGNSFAGSCMVDGKLWLLSENERIITVVDWKTKKTKRLEISEEYVDTYCSMAFLCMVYIEGFIFLFPSCSDVILKINPKTYEISRWEKIKCRNYRADYIYVFKLDETRILAYSREMDNLDLYDAVTNEKEVLSFKFADKSVFLKMITKEGSVFNLAEYIDCILQ